MTQTQKSFVQGAAILGIAGLIVKIIGAFFRIPLTNIIGTEGMGYYGMAYPIYNTLLVISTAGLPTAISKLVSERVAKDDYAGAHDTFRAAWRILLLLGIVTTVIMLALAGPISSLQKSPGAVYSLMAISPALFFVSIMSAYRGYFQGLQNMTPTALSQLLEQVVKLCAGLAIAYGLYVRTGRPEIGAMGALVGVSISEVVALLYMTLTYRRKKGEILARIPQGAPDGIKQNFKPILKQIAIIAIPVTLGACVMPIVNALDSMIVPRSLVEIGYESATATSMYGVLTGIVNSLVNMPAVLSLALAMSLVPAISRARAKNDSLGVSTNASFGLKLALLVGLPCAVGFILLAQPIISMLYRNVAGEELALATGLLQLMSFGLLFLTMIQTMTGVLQGYGKPHIPVIGLAVGAAAKVIVSVTLIRIPEINIYGAPIGTIVCYAIAAVMDIAFSAKYTKFKVRLVGHIIKPIIATALMGAAVWGVYRLLGGHSNTVGVLAAILVGAVVYFFMLMLIGGITRDELQMVPKGNKIERLMIKLKIWK